MNQKNARLHAVKSNVDPLLDLARSTLAENRTDIMARESEPKVTVLTTLPVKEVTESMFCHPTWK